MQEPYILPLNNLKELLEWHPVDLPYISRIPKAKKYVGNYPKTIICHDMAGGYLDDRFCQGVNCYNGYQFSYWPYIDGFIYFSHHFITIPPVSWINCAHLNGIPVYGTFITEGNEGYDICAKMLDSKKSVETIANIMIEIAMFYNFEGWLLNVENCIEEKV